MLSQATAWGHDCGHVPEGHFGEEWIRRITGRGFYHEYFALVLLEDILHVPLPFALKQGIALHSWSSQVMTRPDVTEEARLVALADKLAYVLYDAFEARRLFWTGSYWHLRYGHYERKRLIRELDELILGIYAGYRPFKYRRETPSQYEVSPRLLEKWIRENYLHHIDDVDRLTRAMASHLVDIAARESLEEGRVSFSKSPEAIAFGKLRDWLKRNVYAKADNRELQERILEGCLEYCRREFPRQDPFLVLALMNDLSARKAAMLVGAIPADDYFDPDDDDILSDVHHGVCMSLISDKRIEVDMFAIPDWVTPPT